MANLNTVPGGEDALRRLHEDIVDPLTDAMQGGGSSASGGSGNASGDMSRYNENRNQGPTGAAMPNPFAPNRNTGAAGGAGGAPTALPGGAAGRPGAPGMGMGMPG